MTFRTADKPRKRLLEAGIPSGAAALALHLFTKEPSPLTIMPEHVVDASNARAPVISDEPHAHTEIEEPLAGQSAAPAAGRGSAASSGDDLLSWRNNSQDVANEIAGRRRFHPAYYEMQPSRGPLFFEAAR